MSQPTITRIFDRDLLLDEWCVLDNPILDRIVSTSRWSVHHEVIFQAPDDGKFYRAEYSRGATEQQEEYPWEYEPQVEATEVHQVEVTVKKWVPVTPTHLSSCATHNEPAYPAGPCDCR